MKYKYLYIALFICLIFPQCAQRYKIEYNIPPNYTDAARERLMTSINAGKELYKANCTECHGIFTKGKDKIPNFTNEQLDNYSSRFIRRDPKNHAAAIKMSPQQMNEVLTFLRYKKPKNPDSAFTSSSRTRMR